MMEQTLGQFLDQRRNGNHPTHSSYWPEQANYSLNDSDWGTFWEIFCKELNQVIPATIGDQVTEYSTISLGETIGSHIPMIIPLTLKFQRNDQIDQYEHEDDLMPSEDFIIAMIRVLQDRIEEIYNVGTNKTRLICAVLTPDVYNTKNGIITYNYIFHFPFLRVAKDTIGRFFIPSLISILPSRKLTEMLNSEPLDGWQQRIGNISNYPTYPIYGSTTTEQGHPRKLYALYPDLLDVDDYDNNSSQVNIADVFVFQSYSRVINGTFDNNSFYKDDILELLNIPENGFSGDPNEAAYNEETLRYFWLPIFFSLEFCMDFTLLNEKFSAQRIISSQGRQLNTLRSNRIPGYGSGANSNPSNPSKSPVAEKLYEFIEHEEHRKEMDIMREMIPMLNSNRINNKNSLIKIGMAIYNTCCDTFGKGSVNKDLDEGLAIWIKLCATYGVMGVQECNELYYEFNNNNPFTYRTIAHMVSIDDPDKFTKWKSKFIRPFLDTALNGQDWDIATAFYWCNFLNYFCVVKGGKIEWYQFTNHSSWRISDKGADILMELSTLFSQNFLRLRTSLSRQVERMVINSKADEERKARLNFQISQVDKVCKRLGSSRGKSGIINDAWVLFNTPQFRAYTDFFINVTALSNVVIESGPTECVVRHALPEEYITMRGGVSYPVDGDWQHPIVKDIIKWLCQCYAQVDLNEEGKPIYNHERTFNIVMFILTLWASVLQGRNAHKLLIALTGFGNNSKSMIKKLHKQFLGDYCKDLALSSVNNAGKHNGPDPNLASLKRALEAWISEPDSDAVLMDGLIKLLTGGDSFFARMLNENGGEITASCLVYIMCNKIPRIEPSPAMRRRLLVIHHTGLWSPDAPKDQVEQFNQRHFPEDPDFEQKIPRMARYLAWILVEVYKTYKAEGLQVPPEIKADTEKFWNDNDMYRIFMRENIQMVIIPGSDVNGSKGTKVDSATITKQDLYDRFIEWYSQAYYGAKDTPQRSVIISQLSQHGYMGEVDAQDERWHGYRIVPRINTF